jgi:Tfp pilus assembly protein PilX
MKPCSIRHRAPWRSMRGARSNQRGMILLVVLMVLGMLLLAGAGVMRAVDTGNVISGNFSFQQAAMQASDRAVRAAMDNLATRVASGGANTAASNAYYNVRQSAVDSRGFPSGITWSSVNCFNENGGSVTDCNVDSGGYRIQYVVERQCTTNPDIGNINDIRARCEYEASASALTPTSIALRYRVVIRVRGPRGTEGWYEAMVSGPATS